MTKIDWKWDLSIGQVITIFSVVFTIGAGWAAVNARVDAHEHRINVLTKQAEEMKVADDLRRGDEVRWRLELARSITELQTNMQRLLQAVERRAAPTPSP